MAIGWLKNLFYDEPVEQKRPTVTPADLQARFSDAPILIAFATQTGTAEYIAEDTLEQLLKGHADPILTSFEELTLDKLNKTQQLLIVSSTTFDGEPPDMAEDFQSIEMQEEPDLSHINYGLLCLGDRSYDEFCGFGHRLERWFNQCQAKPWFDAIEVDNEDQDAIDQWHAYIAALLAPPK